MPNEINIEPEVESARLIKTKSKKVINNQNINMKKPIIITAIISIVIGIIIAVTGYFIYTVINMRAQVNQNTQVLGQVVDFINKNIQAQTPAASAPITKTK
jgi:hypothetical protein